jgi:hypothetical protein
MHQIPLTQNALVQHTKRAVLEGVHVWGPAAHSRLDIPNPTDRGWVKQDECPSYNICWTIISPAAEVCPEIVSCNCRKDCEPLHLSHSWFALYCTVLVEIVETCLN